MPLLEARDIIKTFPGVRALDGACLKVRRGEVHALVGENGAGKTTLMHILGGITKPDSGVLRLDGREVRFRTPIEATRHGIGIVFQELSLVPNLSIAENIFANRQPVRFLNRIDFARLHEDTRHLLGLFHLNLNPATPVRRLSVAHQQVVEILKAISCSPRVLILDEPTSSLTATETTLLFENIRRLKSGGMSFIYISHHLPEIFEITDRVTVFRDGQHVNTFDTHDVSEEDLVRNMVGRELLNMFGARTAEIGPEFFHVEHAGRGKEFGDISFSLRKGEILGVAGLVGAGRTELGRALGGAEPLDRGRVLLNGKTLRIRSPRKAIARRIAYVTEDRKEQGLFLGMSLRDNCAAPSLSCFANRFGWMNERAVNDFAEVCRARFDIAAPSVKQRVGALSGGNQQKVLLSMWTGVQPEVLIVDEPTRGVDVGARSEIYAHLRELAASGIGIIMISSDLTEVLGLCDRILVMREGCIAGEFNRAEATEELIIACASGVELGVG